MHGAKVKNSTQLDDYRRRAELRLPPDGPMVRQYKESRGSHFGHLPTLDSLVIATPLGHYKTKVAELGLDPQSVMCQVASRMTRNADGLSFHDQNDRAIGSRMYHALKEVVFETYGARAPAMRIITDTFVL